MAAYGVEAPIEFGGGAHVVACVDIPASRDLVGVAHSVVVRVSVGNYSGTVVPSGAQVAWVGVLAVAVVGAKLVKVARDGVEASDDFVYVAHSVVVWIVVHDHACTVLFTGAGVACVHFVYAHTRVGGGRVVVACERVLASNNFIYITYEVSVSIVEMVALNDVACAVGLSRAHVASDLAYYTCARIGGESIVVACCNILASNDFVCVAYFVTVLVVVDNST
ncbi:MAG: hypothetical protein CMP30_00185 [Roseibacillus sp.]|nr:hypothetical protein [Roseibacillus sp.]